MQSSHELSNLENSPDGALFHIFKHLSPVEIAAMAVVSKRFANIIGNNLAWKHKFQFHYPEKFKILSEWQERANAYYKALTKEDRALFPDITQKLSDQVNIPNFWYKQFVKEDERNLINFFLRRFKKIFYALREGDTRIFNQITFDMIEASNKNDESILDLTRQMGYQSALDEWYAIVEKISFQDRGVSLETTVQQRTILHWAVMLNQYKRILEILQTNPNLLNQKDEFWNTPLMLAADQNQEGIVSLFLQQEKIDISVKNRNGCTALHLAMISGNMAIVDRLLKANSSGFVGLGDLLKESLLILATKAGHLALLEKFVNDAPWLLPNVRSDYKMTLLMVAAWYGQVEIVNFLLNKKAIPLDVVSANFKDTTKNGLTALDFAALNGNVTIVEAIVKAMNEIIALASLKKLLLIAAREKHLALVKWIVEYSHRNYPENKLELLHAQDADSKTPLLFAMYNKDIAMVFFLLKNGAMIALDRSAQKKILLIAASEGYLNLVKQLIEADPSLLNEGDKYGQTALIWATSTGQEIIVEFLLGQPEINVDAVSSNFPEENSEENGCTALYWAACNGYIKIVKALLAKNANASLANAEEELPLHIAAWKGHTTIVRELIAANPGSLNQPNVYKETPILLASCNNHLSTVQFLLTQRGISVDNKVENSFFPQKTSSLIAAVSNNNIEMTKALLDAGADINISDTVGNQSIHYAARNLRVGMMELLLEKDPSLVNQVNKNGMTPLMSAVFDEEYHQVALPAVEFLLKQPKIDVWAMNVEEAQHGWTALHYAADRKNYAHHDNDDVVKAILKPMLTDILKPGFSKSLIVPINCEKLTKKTSFAIQLLQLALEEKKREVLTPYSPDLFSNNKRQAVVYLRIKDTIQVTALLINLIIYDQDPKDYESDIARFHPVLEDNAELKIIYDELCKVDSNFKLVPRQLIPNQ